jgi:hypothetical protein
MSHIVSLRSASLRALRSRSTATAAVNAAATYPHRPSIHQQQYSFSTLPPSSTRILTAENNKVTKRVRKIS